MVVVDGGSLFFFEIEPAKDQLGVQIAILFGAELVERLTYLYERLVRSVVPVHLGCARPEQQLMYQRTFKAGGLSFEWCRIAREAGKLLVFQMVQAVAYPKEMPQTFIDPSDTSCQFLSAIIFKRIAIEHEKPSLAGRINDIVRERIIPIQSGQPLQNVTFPGVFEWLLPQIFVEQGVPFRLTLVNVNEILVIVHRKKAVGFGPWVNMKRAYTRGGIGFSEVIEDLEILPVESREAALGRKPHIPQLIFCDGIDAVLGQTVFISVLFNLEMR